MNCMQMDLPTQGARLYTYFLDSSPELRNSGRRPAVIVCPGGAYQFNSDREAEPIALAFCAQGVHACVLRYPCAPARFPTALCALAQAVAWVREHAEEYHVDPDRILVCGFSAGGHLAASLGVFWHQPFLAQASGVSADRCRPNGMILCYPVITSGKYANRESFRALLGIDPDERDLEYMSLEKHVTEDTPPCFLWQTATDASVPVENSYLFAGACRKAGVPFAHHVFSDGIHGMSVATEEWLDKESEELYTLEQIRLLAEAVMAGKTPCAPEKGEELIREFALDGRKRERWTPEAKERLRGLLDGVDLWSELAEKWLARELGLK